MKVRLHKYLTNIIRQDITLEWTNPEIQRNIANYGVWVEGELVENRLLWIQGYEEVDFSHWPSRKKADFSKIEVVLERPELILINKPKGLVVQPGNGHEYDNLLSWLKETYPNQTNLNDQSLGLVHRLDKNTTGLLLVARTDEDLNFFRDQFQNRLVEKEYLAILEGQLENSFLVENYQTRSKTNPQRQKLFWSEKEALSYDLKAKYAKSIFTPVMNCKDLNLSLVKVKIYTGRMHQIRLQAQHLGFPLWQEETYKIAKKIPLKGSIRQSIPLNKVQELSVEAFQNLQIEIFGELGYSLKSNHLKIKTKNGTIIDSTLKELNEADIF